MKLVFLKATYLNQQLSLDARVSPETATLVDMETRRILEEAVGEASSILSDHRPTLDRLADLLCEHETVDGSQIEVTLGQEEKQGEGKVFPWPAPNGHKTFQTVAKNNGAQRPKGKFENV